MYSFRRQLRWLGFWAETEQANSRLRHRSDICAVGLTLPTTYLEVNVSHPLIRGTASAHLARGSSVSAFVEEAWRRRLSFDYGGGPPANVPFALVPAVVNSYGGGHPEFVRWWRGAVRAALPRSACRQ